MNSAPSNGKNVFHFGPFTVDGANFVVRKEDQAVTIAPRAFDVLVVLLINAGRVVEKQEIFDAVWKDTFVTDNALTKIIKDLRHALEDSAENPRYIETIPKRGYRFTGQLKNAEIPGTADPGDSRHDDVAGRASFSRPVLALSIVAVTSILIAAAWLVVRYRPAPNSGVEVRSIAVLPFKPLNAESRDESLEMGMAETLITRLSNLRQVIVRPMSAVRKYTDPGQDAVAAGREVQAEAVLEGSIQKAGERIRVTVRLINVRSGAPLWSEQFDEKFTDIFAVQDSIAERVAGALALQLSGQEKEQLVKHYTNSPEAYQLYMKGQLIWNRRSQNWMDQSLASYQQALEKDPNFALALIGVADGYIMQSGHRHITMQEAEEKARPAILRALEIDDSLAQAHNALAELKYQYEYDWTGAGDEFRKAIALNPNIAWIHQAYGWYMMSMGRFDEAKTEMEKARELDPSSLTINTGRGRLFYFSRQYDEAIRHFVDILAAEPNDASVYNSLNAAYEQKGMYAEAVDVFIKVNFPAGEVAQEYRDAFTAGGYEGFLRKKLQKEEEASAKTGIVSPSNMANIYVRLGDKEKAFFWFEKVFERRDSFVLQFKVEPAFDPLRDDPRYAVLLHKMGLEP
jgi:DNA-binding winged helix-turn-helix (wHTH) protein/TolB-like protein/Tfp pilus assembly protein PilF